MSLTIISARGRLVRARHVTDDRPPPPGGRRGTVTRFSAASRRRLQQLLAQAHPHGWVFVTLTYHDLYPDAHGARAHLRVWLKRLRRAYLRACAVWRLEFQQRGAPHFHLLIYNAPGLSAFPALVNWRHVTSDDTITEVDVRAVHGARGIAAYVSKYVAKVPPPAPLDTQCISGRAPGFRWWGVEFRKDFPWLPLREEGFDDRDSRLIHQWRRAAYRKRGGRPKAGRVGVWLFSDDGERWLRYAALLQSQMAATAGRGIQPD